MNSHSVHSNLAHSTALPNLLFHVYHPKHSGLFSALILVFWLCLEHLTRPPLFYNILLSWTFFFFFFLPPASASHAISLAHPFSQDLQVLTCLRTWLWGPFCPLPFPFFSFPSFPFPSCPSLLFFSLHLCTLMA